MSVSHKEDSIKALKNIKTLKELSIENYNIKKENERLKKEKKTFENKVNKLFDEKEQQIESLVNQVTNLMLESGGN